MGLGKLLRQLASISLQDAEDIASDAKDQKRFLSKKEMKQIDMLLDEREEALDEAKKQGWGLG